MLFSFEVCNLEEWNELNMELSKIPLNNFVYPYISDSPYPIEGEQALVKKKTGFRRVITLSLDEFDATAKKQKIEPHPLSRLFLEIDTGKFIYDLN